MNFAKPSKMTKVIKQDGHPSKISSPELQKSTNLGLKIITKSSFSYLLPCVPQHLRLKLCPHYNFIQEKSGV